MRHIQSEELIDLAEGARPESSAPHLQTCDDCRRRLAELRAAMAAAAHADVPEPSPLFWDHFSARLHDAIAAEGPPPRAAWFPGSPKRRGPSSWWNRLVLPLSAAACAAVIVAAVTLRVAHAPVFVGPPSPPVASAVPARPGNDDVADADLALFPNDPSLDLVADLASQVAQADWDAAGPQGLETHEDAADKAVGHLSAGERRELQRLLKEELARPGA
jgi:hypothetical protein